MQDRRISIHALLAESDRSWTNWPTIRHLFLSTLSLRRATPGKGPTVKGYWNFYPRSPCGERRRKQTLQVVQNYFYPRSPCGERPGLPVAGRIPPRISIHALLAESDTIFAVRPYDAPIFLSTLSLRRATMQSAAFRHVGTDFYPRSPCGERLGLLCMLHKIF